HLESQKNPRTRFVVEPFKQANSSSNDFSPMLLEKEGMVFSSDREEATGKKEFGRLGGSYSDLFLLTKKQTGPARARVERWVSPAIVLPGGINTDYNEGTPSFDAKGSTMYYTQCNGADGKRPNCVIMMA